MIFSSTTSSCRIFLIIPLILLFITACKKSEKRAPVAENGILDLSKWDFEKDGPVNLSGKWEFYWKKHITHEEFKQTDQKPSGFLKVPGYWNDFVVKGKKIPPTGYATYKLRVLLKDKMPYSAFKLQSVCTAFSISVNGRKISSSGKIGKNRESVIPEWKPHVATFKSDQKELEIIIQASNYHYAKGGIWRAIKLGRESDIREIRERNVAFELFLFGSIFIMGLYHITLFLLRRKDKSALYFAFFCLLIAFRSILTGNERYFVYLTGISWELSRQFSFIIIYLIFPAGAMFVNKLFPDELNKWAVRILQFLGIIFTAITIFTSSLFFSKILPYFFMFSILLIIYCIYAMILALKRNREGAWYFFGGFFIFLITGINDMLFDFQIIQTGNFLAFGLYIFIFSQAFLLSLKFSKAFFAVETLTTELTKLNVAYRRFVPQEFLSHLNKDSITDVMLGDHIEKEMAILFCDIRGFTTLSESMTPEENFQFINALLKRVGPIIRDSNGFIDKFIGDAIMALFPNKIEDSIRAALNMRKGLLVYNQHRASSGYKPVDFGIGIHSGKMMLGTIGEKQRMEGTVIADAVNLASRLESLTKIFGVPIIISENAFNRIENHEKYHTRHLGKVLVKGKRSAVSVVEVFDGEPEEILNRRIKTLKSFENGVTAYAEKNHTRARECFFEVLKEDPDDNAADFYIKQIEKNQKSLQF